MSLPIIRFQPQRHRRVQGGHPWIYSNEIVMDAEAKACPPGSLVEFRTHDKQFIGKGSFNHHCLIAGRVFSRNIVETIDAAWVSARIEDALALRNQLVAEPFYRLIHAEADGLPGLIVDRFGPHLTVQVNTAGMERLWPQIEGVLVSLLKPASITLRNDGASRTIEGLPREVRVVHGKVEGLIEVRENGLTYFADLAGGQKTGWYFDQRDNHALIARFVKNKTMLDLYCHAGGFGLLAAKAGASRVVSVDSSEPALALARKAAEVNNVAKLCTWHCADVFDDLEKRRVAGELYDIVIADPPAFVKARKDINSGGKGYRKLAKMSAYVAAPQGLLFIASCSHNMELPMFIEQIAAGLHDAKRTGRILHTVFAAPDHPVHPHLPESAYLKGVLLRLD